jgi:hypothetical protein
MFSVGNTLEVKLVNQEEEQRRESCLPADSRIRMADVTGIKPVTSCLSSRVVWRADSPRLVGVIPKTKPCTAGVFAVPAGTVDAYGFIQIVS